MKIEDIKQLINREGIGPVLGQDDYTGILGNPRDTAETHMKRGYLINDSLDQLSKAVGGFWDGKKFKWICVNGDIIDLKERTFKLSAFLYKTGKTSLTEEQLEPGSVKYYESLQKETEDLNHELSVLAEITEEKDKTIDKLIKENLNLKELNKQIIETKIKQDSELDAFRREKLNLDPLKEI